MKKVLILAYDFPPLVSIGAQRPYSWYKYLPDMGVDITVVTRHWSEDVNSPEEYVKKSEEPRVVESHYSNSRVIRLPFSPNCRDKLLLNYGYYEFQFFRKILTAFYSYIEWQCYFFDAKSFVYFEAKRLLGQEKFDLIVATGEPFILFKYASTLSREFNIPWVADYRDGWTSNQGGNRLNWVQKIQLNYFKYLELKIVGSASLITTAAYPYKKEIEKTFPQKEIEVVHNGFDDSYLDGIKDISLRRDKFVISYAGMIYPHQRLETFLQAVIELLNEGGIKNRDIEIIFYGANAFPDTKKRILDFSDSTREIIVTTNRIPYGELLKKLKQSHLLLLLSKKNANWLNTKIFDYFAVNRPIILVENDCGVLEDLIKQTGSGYSLNNVTEIKRVILKEFEFFKNDVVGNREFNSNCLQYTRKKQAEIFFNMILKKVKKTE